MARRARDERDWDEIAAFGRRLRKAREDAGITQVEMAERLGVAQPYISNWERGVHLPGNVPKVAQDWARETGTSLEDLLKSRCLYRAGRRLREVALAEPA